MRTVLSYLKQYRRESILAPAFKMLEVLFDLLVPLVVAQMIDVGVASGDRVYILQRVLLLIGFAFLGMACSFTAICPFWSRWSTARIEKSRIW